MSTKEKLRSDLKNLELEIIEAKKKIFSRFTKTLKIQKIHLKKLLEKKAFLKLKI